MNAIKEIEISINSHFKKMLDEDFEGSVFCLAAYASVYGISASEINTSICENILEKISDEIIESDHYNPVYFDQAYAFYLTQFNEILEKTEANFKIIRENFQLLRSKERSLVTYDEFGCKDTSKLLNYIVRFSTKFLAGTSITTDNIKHSGPEPVMKIIYYSNFFNIIPIFTFFHCTVTRKLMSEGEDEVITGEDYEDLLKSLIEREIPGSFVLTTPKTGDHGVDLVVECKNIKIAVQAKYYSSNVGNSAVQEIYSGMRFTNSDHGMVICEGGYTKHAHELAAALGIYLETTQSCISAMKSLFE